ncbi:MAG: tRNA pseudouridine(55) synthase TruB [Candidatus Sungbacteria bacterium RIFCSPLOWO2_01_FULL_59_16]|uniref:tRNA pseudouridine synthase B n=1 Tax=Candidatus Sungbacteria bacterium RIFCSPLOWO2_01_FULL_59_16 TaxID=1802280 RepID=A0A1G2LCU6_9BACT|nr:MAG: tRNA pseudouridine(55) synthase TruB [Candidatus Sungbacteria bacterium RIFCSPLOWO2_01_FULL_59_16]
MTAIPPPGENFIALYKPKGPTSHDVVDAVRKATGERTVGHAGTLDPLARGILVVAIGRAATRQLKTIVGSEKEYIADIRLGASSTTDDAEGTTTMFPPSAIPDRDAVVNALQKFVGTIEQTPPAYSAVKIRGAPAHRRMRRGETIELKSRAVTIQKIELLSYAWPDLRIRVTTGPGVYIRALARDIGAALGTAGYLADLERTRVGAYTSKMAVPLDRITAALSSRARVASAR